VSLSRALQVRTLTRTVPSSCVKTSQHTTGKTVLLREIIEFLGFPSPRTAVTASTGIASINIGGTTLHSWAGIGLGKEPAERLAGKILGTKDLRERWWFVESLVIDESKIFFIMS
jgi:ATP-dependent DNA helicase PIF1